MSTKLASTAHRAGRRVQFAGFVLGVVVAGCSTAVSPSPSPAASQPPATASQPLPSPTATLAPSSTASAAATPVPASPSASLSSEDWRPVPAQDSVQSVQFLHVVWTGTSFVATGFSLDAEGVFLDSTDGLQWHRQPMSTALAYPDAVASGPRGVVAVGTINARLATWASSDGLTWTTKAGAFPLPPVGKDIVKVTAVVATDDGWLAVGRRDPYCTLDCGLAPFSAMAWTSSDGLHWTRVPDQASFSKAAMTGVARLGSGYVAVGLAKGRGVVWTSTDGSTWARVHDDPIFHPRSSTDPTSWIEMTGVAAGHGVVVAVGRDAATMCTDTCDSSVRAWWSADGRTWAKATGERFPQGQVFSVTATPRGFLATGPSGDPSCTGGIWASTDGRTWQCGVSANPAFTDFSPYAAAGSSSIEVAVGLGGSDQPSDGGSPGAVWWRPIP